MEPLPVEVYSTGYWVIGTVRLILYIYIFFCYSFVRVSSLKWWKYDITDIFTKLDLYLKYVQQELLSYFSMLNIIRI